MNNVVKIALVDDHQMFLDALSALLEGNKKNIKIVLTAQNGQDMIAKLKDLKKQDFPDVFIIDVNMPFMNGIETVQWLQQNRPEAKVAIVTMSNKPEIILELVKLGVKSYLTKDKSPTDLLSAISLVSQDKFYFPDEITEIIVAAYKNGNETTTESDTNQN